MDQQNHRAKNAALHVGKTVVEGDAHRVMRGVTIINFIDDEIPEERDARSRWR